MGEVVQWYAYQNRNTKILICFLYINIIILMVIFGFSRFFLYYHYRFIPKMCNSCGKNDALLVPYIMDKTSGWMTSIIVVNFDQLSRYFSWIVKSFPCCGSYGCGGILGIIWPLFFGLFYNQNFTFFIFHEYTCW